MKIRIESKRTVTMDQLNPGDVFTIPHTGKIYMWAVVDKWKNHPIAVNLEEGSYDSHLTKGDRSVQILDIELLVYNKIAVKDAQQ